MATTEQVGLLTYVDSGANRHILYPVTTMEAVDGLGEALASGLAGKAEKSHSHARSDVDGLEEALAKNTAKHNLLDNSDFTNPVDQRNGEAPTATLTSNQGYGIDRWYYYGAQGTKATDGINFTILTNGMIWQYLETEQEGKTLTAVVELADGSRIVGNGVVPAFSGRTAAIIQISMGSGRRVDVNLSNQGKLQFIITIGSGSMKIANCALYVGEYTETTAPAYQPKGYAAELAECQRYYLPVAQTSTQYLTAHFTHSGRCSIITPALPMRVTPSIMTFGGSAQVYVPATGWRDISPFIETAAHSPMQGNAYQVVFDTINGLTSGNSYIVRNIKALSADI